MDSNEALKMLNGKLDRSRWSGCEYCKGDLEGYTSCLRSGVGEKDKRWND